jgi:small-conductance mechanosensitive channel
VLAPLDFPRIEAVLRTPPGWIELALVVAAFAIGWLVDHQARKRREEQARAPLHKLTGGVVRMAMPLIALAILVVARAIWKRYLPSHFIDIGIALAFALAAIRMTVYTLRRLVPTAAWLRTWERTVSFGVWAVVVLHLFGVTPEIAQDLDELRFRIGDNEITALTLLKGTVAVVVTIAITLWLSGLLEQRLMKSEMDLSQRALASKVVRALLLVVGLLVALQAIGIDLTLLSVFGGALGVGIGLGLQKLASNYIAGFVILLDRSIRLGDLVTVSDRYGVVTAVTSRYVVVRSPDGVEAIVPNETLVTTTVLNHSFSHKDVRLALNLQVAYGTDLDSVLALMCEVARSHPRVLTGADRAPAAFVVRFVESGIELELGVWIRDPENGQLPLRSDLNRALLKAFEQAGMTMPFPRRDYRVVETAAAPEAAAKA